jgi:hypothetical protein
MPPKLGELILASPLVASVPEKAPDSKPSTNVAQLVPTPAKRRTQDAIAATLDILILDFIFFSSFESFAHHGTEKFVELVDVPAALKT